MAKPNAANERIKREYFSYLRDALGRDEATIDAAAKALARFEESTGAKDFKKFHRQQAMAFKRRLAEAHGKRSGEKLSKATVHATLRNLKAFFEWLSREPGFRSHIAWADADYFNLSEKDTAVARARREKTVPTLEQVRRVLECMPAVTVLDRRDRALVAFTAITAARVGALASLQLRHVDLAGGYVDQDARVVQTKSARRSAPISCRRSTKPCQSSSAGLRNWREIIFGDQPTRCSRRHAWRSATMGASCRPGWSGAAGRLPNRSVRYFVGPSRRLACPISIHTASATCWCATR